MPQFSTQLGLPLRERIGKILVEYEYEPDPLDTGEEMLGMALLKAAGLPQHTAPSSYGVCDPGQAGAKEKVKDAVNKSSSFPCLGFLNCELLNSEGFAESGSINS